MDICTQTNTLFFAHNLNEVHSENYLTLINNGKFEEKNKIKYLKANHQKKKLYILTEDGYINYWDLETKEKLKVISIISFNKLITFLF